jgi:hypothetical protein
MATGKAAIGVQLQRLFAGPIEIDAVFQTTLARTNYLANGRCYPGHICTSNDPVDLGKLFIVNADKSDYFVISGSSTKSLSQVLTDGNQANMTIDMASHSIINLQDVNDPTSAVSKAYVDARLEGIKGQMSVDYVTTGDLGGTYDNGTLGVGATITAPLASTSFLDGLTHELGDSVLVIDNINKNENGLYDITSLTTNLVLTRSTKFDEATTEVFSNYLFFVKEGATFSGCGFFMTTGATVVMGTSELVFNQYSRPAVYQPGYGLSLVGNIFSFKASDASGTGLEVDPSYSYKMRVKPDTTSGASVVQVKVSANGTGVGIDNDTIKKDVNGDMYVNGYAAKVNKVELDNVVIAIGTSTLDHNLNKAELTEVIVYDTSNAGKEKIQLEWKPKGMNQVEVYSNITFPVAKVIVAG